jgi:hypothetical protein
MKGSGAAASNASCLPVNRQHHGQPGEEHQDRPAEVHQSRAQDLPDRRYVIRDPGHQVACLVLVEETLIQALDV